ncbi:sulfate transporter [Thalassoporum mexicanum PCC 7367]|uniref:bicarbonate transporter BicA n=1 Tax=Thalassoporum mexicanum TaxID=3457544 RepID=UPI0002A00136|nr:SulP family inorganic anion transporter [Pseudanabaena sp. PCC 7367]AFY71594.1 sulfate transporter [Pseudanabaena sp. PCC 7367]
MRITNRIHLRNLRGDIFGGVTAAIIAIPMALVFGEASGAGATAGLYGAILVGFFAALFGGTPTLISEPTGPMTVIMTAVIAHLTVANPDNGMAMAFTVVMMAGVFQIIFGFLRLGKFITLMPYTVISGFMSGIGIILIILQIIPFFGADAVDGGSLDVIRNIPNISQQINPTEAGLGIMTIAILFLTPGKLKRILPPQLTALVVGMVVYFFFLRGTDVAVIGQINAGLPQLQMPTFSPDQLQIMVIDALVLSVLGCIDALLTSVVADSLTRSQHNSDKELIGQGLGNLVSGLCGGIAGAGATMGTVVNIQAGGRTALSGLTRAFILLVLVLTAGQLGFTEIIPMSVLAGIAIKVGFDIIDWSFLKRAHEISWKGSLIMYGVILLTVFVDLIWAVGIGVFVANVLTIQKLSELRSKDVQLITDADDAIVLNDEQKDLLRQTDGRVLLFHLSGPMIFGVAKAISRENQAIESCDALILDLSDVPHLGVTSSLALENAIKDAIEEERHIFIVGATGQIKRRLETLKIMEMIPPERLLLDLTMALRFALEIVETRPRSVGENRDDQDDKLELDAEAIADS